MKYNLKRGLHRVFKKRFIPSGWYCFTEGKHVTDDHKAKYPSHFVQRLNAVKPTKPRPEQFKFRSRYPRALATNYPSKVDYSEKLLAGGFEVYDQGQQGSCAANAGCANKAWQEILRGTFAGDFSRAFLYWMMRKRHGWENEDTGAEMADITAVLGENGVCLNKTMPYSQFDYTTAPSQEALDEARQWTSDRDETRLSWDELKAALFEGPVMVDGIPAGFSMIGVPIYKSFEQALYNGGYVPVPRPDEELLGYHAMDVVGCDDEKTWGGIVGYHKILNSWGMAIGDKGFVWMPYAYESKTGPQSDNRIQFDSVPGPGPQPQPNCEQDDINCTLGCVNAGVDFFTMLFCGINCLLGYFDCKFTRAKLQKMIDKAVGKKGTKTKSKIFARFGVRVSLTVEKMSKEELGYVGQ